LHISEAVAPFSFPGHFTSNVVGQMPIKANRDNRDRKSYSQATNPGYWFEVLAKQCRLWFSD